MSESNSTQVSLPVHPQFDLSAPHALTEARRYVQEVEAKVPCPPEDAPVEEHVAYIKWHVVEPLVRGAKKCLHDEDDELEMYRHGHEVINHLLDDLNDPNVLRAITENCNSELYDDEDSELTAIEMIARVKRLLPKNASGEIVGRLIQRVYDSINQWYVQRGAVRGICEELAEHIVRHLEYGEPLDRTPMVTTFLALVRQKIKESSGEKWGQALGEMSLTRKPNVKAP